jgi:phage gp16-like protein
VAEFTNLKENSNLHNVLYRIKGKKSTTPVFINTVESSVQAMISSIFKNWGTLKTGSLIV